MSKSAIIQLIALSKKHPITQNDLINYLRQNKMLRFLSELQFKPLYPF